MPLLFCSFHRAQTSADRRFTVPSPSPLKKLVKSQNSLDNLWLVVGEVALVPLEGVRGGHSVAVDAVNGHSRRIETCQVRAGCLEEIPAFGVVDILEELTDIPCCVNPFLRSGEGLKLLKEEEKNFCMIPEFGIREEESRGAEGPLHVAQLEWREKRRVVVEVVAL